MLTCTPCFWCEIRRYWSGYGRGFCGAVFEFPLLLWPTHWQTEKVCLFVQHPLPHLRTLRKTGALLETECEWCMELSSVITLIPHSFLLLVFWAFVLLLAGRWGRLLEEEADWRHSVVNSPPVYLFSIFPLLSTSISSSLHLLGNRNYLSPCKGASSIPWFIARCHRNGSFFDWIEGVPAFVSLPGHGYMW